MEFPAYETLLTAIVAPHVLQVTLNRPQVLNALNTQMGHDLLDVWTRVTADPGDVRCVVLTASGERAFCAGGDLKQRDGMTVQAWRMQHELFERAFMALIDCPTPVIAAVNGVAYGGGLEILLGCDFAYGPAGAKFALSEVRLGIMPGSGGTQTLTRAVGERRAKELILSTRAFTAEEGLEWGVFNRVFPAADVLREAVAMASAIAANAPLSVRQAKRSIHFGQQMDLRTAYRFEIEAYNQLVGTEDRLEGVRAFNEKRKPEFKGR